MSGRLGNKAFSNIKLHKNEDSLIMIPHGDTFRPLIKKDLSTGNYFFNTDFVNGNSFNGPRPSIVISTYEDRIFRSGESITVTCTIILEAGQTLDTNPVTLSIGTLQSGIDMVPVNNSDLTGPFVFSKEIIFNDSIEDAANQEIQITLKYKESNDDPHTIIGKGQSITFDKKSPVFILNNGDGVNGNRVLQHQWNTLLTLNKPEFTGLSSDSYEYKNMQISDFVPSLDINTLGSYVKTYTATDLAGNVTSKTLTVIVSDNTKSIISIIGNNPDYLLKDQDYIDKGATVFDYNGDDVAERDAFNDNSGNNQYPLTISTLNIDLSIEYSDNNPTNTADDVTRTVTVFEKSPPIITTNPGQVSSGDVITINFTKPHDNNKILNAAVVESYILEVKDLTSDNTIISRNIDESETSFDIDTSQLPYVTADYNIVMYTLYQSKFMGSLPTDADSLTTHLTSVKTNIDFNIKTTVTMSAGAILLEVGTHTARVMNSVSNEKTVNVYANLNKEYMDGLWTSSQTIYGIEFDINCNVGNIVSIKKFKNSMEKNYDDVTVNSFDEGSTNKTTIVIKGYNNLASNFDKIKVCTITLKNVNELQITDINLSTEFDDWNTKTNDNLAIEDFEISGIINL